MSFLGRVKTGRRFGAIMLATIVGGALACNVDRTELNFQEGDYVFEFLADQSLTAPLPAGTNDITDFSLAAIDLTITDGFQRSVAGTSAGYATDGTDYGPGWNFGGWDRNNTSDMRTPALTEDDAVITAADGFVIGDPAEVGAPSYHNPFIEGTISGLAPNSTYIVAFFRYGLNQNQENDTEATLLGQTVNPDALVLSGGSGPAGDPTVQITSFPTIVPFAADANPYIAGFFPTDANGEGFFDCVLDGSGGLLYATDTGAPSDADFDISLVARNDDAQTVLPRYNYMVILEGPATDAADAADNPQAMRVQMGQDFVASTGEMINNAYGPFPAGALDITELLVLPVAAGAASVIEMTFQNLPDLGGDVYQVWLWNEETGDILSPAGDWTAVDAEAVEVGSGTGVRTFTSQYDWTHTFITSDAIAGQSVGEYTHVFLSVESSAASTPSAAQPLWTQYTNMNGAPEDPFQWEFVNPADFSFGNFASGAPAMWSLPAVARGQGGFWGSQCVDSNGDGRCEGTTDILVVNVRNIPLPPEGFFYGGWLIDDDGEPLYAGDLLTTFDEGRGSLRDLDQSYDACVSGGECPSAFASSDGLLLRSETFTQASDLGGQQFYDMAMYYLTLMPKGATDEPGVVILGGVMPEPLKDRKPEPADGT